VVRGGAGCRCGARPRLQSRSVCGTAGEPGLRLGRATSRTSSVGIVRFLLTLIFVHGACVRDAAWWWGRMSAPLADHGIDSVAVPLPSCGEAGGELGDLYADVGACGRAIAEAEGPVVLCGHSYGGMVITEAGADDRVTQLLYVTSVMAELGQSQSDLIGSEPAPWLMPGDDGTIGVNPDLIREFFLQDCDEVTTEHALARLTRQSLTPFTQPARQISWQQKAATYFVCTEDLATPAQVQRQRVKENVRLVEFQAGHHPFLSRPEAFAQSIAAAIDRIG
jgi:pimeloyl-ACP methyl ester carboxylesterase